MTAATPAAGSKAAAVSVGADETAPIERIGSGAGDDGAGGGVAGSLHIEDRVVEKIASQAVREVSRASGAPRSILGRTLGSGDAEHEARVSAQVDGSVATVRVDVAVDYPAPVRTVARETREHVMRRVRELTGVEVREVDIDVRQLLTRSRKPPRVV